MRDRSDAYAEADCVVLGASFDTPAANKAFRDAQHFGYRLLSDLDKTTGGRYQVLPPADAAFQWPLRIAYLIDPEGMIRRSFKVTDVAGFADMVLGDLRTLQAA